MSGKPEGTNQVQTPALAARHDASETGWRSWLSIPQDRFNGPWMTFLLILIAWSACALIRYQWIAWADGFEQFKWEGVIQPTTHDAFTHGAMLQYHVEGMHDKSLGIYPLLNKQGALHVLSWAFLKVFPLPIATFLLWAPVFLGSLMVVPMVLIGRLFGSSLLGFTAALIGGVAWNYYERSMAGYFDTDLFSFWIALLLMFFMMAAHERRSMLYAGLGAFAVFLYPFFYAKGLVIGSSIAGCFIGLQLIYMLFRKEAAVRLRMIALVAAGTAASPWSNGGRIYNDPWLWFIGVAVIAVVWWYLARDVEGLGTARNGRADPSRDQDGDQKQPKARGSMAVPLIVGACLLWLLLSMPWGYFVTQLETYSHFLDENTSAVASLDPVELQRAEILDEINFRKTHKHTVLESQNEDFKILAQRMLGSVTGTILAFIGYILLCIRYPSFLIGLPMVAIGLFAFDGGLRFTTWAGVVGPIALVYLLFIIVQGLLRFLPTLTLGTRRVGSVVGGMILAAPFIWVNMTHAISFKVSPVFSLDAIKAMQAIKQASSPGDYVLAWWDYGSGLWYYTGRHVLMTPISASDDCWTVSTCITSGSEKVAAGLARLSVEEAAQGHMPTSHAILGLDGGVPIQPEQMIKDLENGKVDLPAPTRKVFLYYPMEMIRLLSVLEAYADPDYALPTMPESGVYHYLPPGTVKLINQSEILIPGIQVIVDLGSLQTFILNEQGQKIPIQFKSVILVLEDEVNGPTGVQTGPTAIHPIPHLTARGGSDTEYRLIAPGQEPDPGFYMVNLVVLTASGSIMIMDDEFLNSNTIQMVVMQKFDHDLWDLVYKSGYARVFELKNTVGGDAGTEIVEEAPVP